MVGRVSHRLCQLTFPASILRSANALICAFALAACAGLGCHDRECEAARLELAQTWETLRDTAPEEWGGIGGWD